MFPKLIMKALHEPNKLTPYIVLALFTFTSASFLNVPFSHIALAAAIPAFLYFVGMYIQVDGYSAKNKLEGKSKSELPNFLVTLKEGWFYIASFLVLIYFLMVLSFEAQAPFYAMSFLLIITFLKKKTRLSWKRIEDMLYDAGKMLAELVAIIAGVGLIVGALSITGVSFSFSRELVMVVGGSAFLILLAGAITSFVLGMGMTVSAVYVFLAIIMAPALVEVGFNPIAAHLFVIYWATVSYITPPVAIAAFASAEIAGAKPMKTAMTAVKLGSVKYIIPFAFVYNPALVAQGPISEIIITFITTLIAVIIVASTLEGWLMGIGRLNSKLSRILLLGSGLLLFMPSIILNLLGFISIILIIFTLYLKKNKIGSAIKETVQKI